MSKKMEEPLFLLVVVLFWFAQYTFVTYFTPYLTGTLGFAATVAGTIVGAYGMTQLFVRIPLGVGADIMQKHKAIIGGGFIMLMLAGILLNSSSSYTALVMARVLAGVSASTWVSFIVLYSTIRRNSSAGNSSGKAMAANNLGMLLAYLFGSFTFDKFGIKFLFSASIIAAAVGFSLVFFVSEEKDAGKKPMTLSGVLLVAKDKNLWNCSLLTALMQLVAYATALSFTTTYAKALGAGGFELGINSMIFSTASMLAAMWIGVSKRSAKSDWIVNIVAFAMTAVYCSIIPNCITMTGIYVAQVIGGFARSLIMASLMGMSSKNIPPELRSTAMGAFQSIYSLGMSVGPVIMGGILDYSGGSYFVAFMAMAGFSAAGSLWSAMTLRPVVAKAG